MSVHWPFYWIIHFYVVDSVWPFWMEANSRLFYREYMYIKKILINTLLTTHICYYPCVHKYKQRLLQVLFVLLNLIYFIVCLYLYCCSRTHSQEGEVRISLIVLHSPHWCACRKPGLWFSTSYFLVFSGDTWFEVRRWFFFLLV
jgi:hypothetical protein